jgi:hypothetical protein
LFIGAGVVIIVLYSRYNKYIRRVEEEKRKQNEGCVKDGGVEMLEKLPVWSADIIGGGLGQLSELGCSEMEKEDENCSSSADLLPNEVKLISVSPSSCLREEKNAEEPPSYSSSPEMKMEKGEEGVSINCGESTTSLTFLVDGLSCEDPFEKEIVDGRDTLLSFILSEEENDNYSERMGEVVKLCEKIIPLLMHILSLGEEGSKWLIGFGPIGIVKNGDDYFVVCEEGLMEKSGEKGRWKAPEILNKEEEKETEKSCVFTMGMTIYTIIGKKKPFDEDNEEVAIGKIMIGERPDLRELEEKECRFVSIMKECWDCCGEERLCLIELRDKVIDGKCGNTLNEEEEKGEEESKKEEGEKKEDKEEEEEDFE